MSRKTTSGVSASSAASASAPLRHSPATVNSGNAANSCRTPRRAAGSSSTIKTLHSTCFMVGLRGSTTGSSHDSVCTREKSRRGPNLFGSRKPLYQPKGMREESNQVALWVLRAQCGDREALELLLRHVQPSLRRYLTGLVGASDADDALQEALLLIYRKLKSLEAPELFRPWAFRIASRAGLHHIKKRRHWSEHVQAQDSLDDVPAANASIDAEGLQELLATKGISPACSAVLTLYFEEQMTLADVAEALEIPLGTV